MASTLTAKLDRSVTIDGVLRTNPNRTTGITHSVDNVIEFRKTISASTTADLVDLTDSSFADAFPSSFKYLEITVISGESGSDKHAFEFITDKGTNADVYTITCPVNGFFVLNEDGSYSGYTADFAAGALDSIESIRIKNESSTTSAVVNVFIAG